MINVWFDNGDGEALDEEVALGDDLSDWLSDAALPDATSSVSTAAEDTVARNLEEGGSWFGRQYVSTCSSSSKSKPCDSTDACMRVYGGLVILADKYSPFSSSSC